MPADHLTASGPRIAVGHDVSDWGGGMVGSWMAGVGHAWVFAFEKVVGTRREGLGPTLVSRTVSMRTLPPERDTVAPEAGNATTRGPVTGEVKLGFSFSTQKTEEIHIVLPA